MTQGGVPMFGESSIVPTARAGFWVRFAAALIDSVILSIGGTLLLSGAGSAQQSLDLLLWAAYLVVFFGSSRGQTPGFMIMGLKVVSLSDGGPIGYGRATVRLLVGLISTLPLLLGYFWMLWDKEKQTWHDKAANCIVVPSR